MNPKKQKEKDRRRARKLAAEAWEAVDAGNLDLAEKIIRRAVAAQEDNPVHWSDQGSILAMRQKEADAAEAFRAAISLAPNFAEPYARLATLRIRQGFLAEAVSLQTEAVRHAPENSVYAEQLAAFQALAESERPAIPASVRDVSSRPAAVLDEGLRERVAAVDWEAIVEGLTGVGCGIIERLLDSTTCEYLRSLFDCDERFDRTVVMDRPGFGQGVYRYFRAPIPEQVDQLRRTVYPQVARIANQWQQLLGETERFAEEWDGFCEKCRVAGQTTPTPILLKYGPGGFNSLHRDLRGSVYFPIQMAIVLSPRADQAPNGFQGGEFLFCDVPESRKSRRRSVPGGLGDAILFCTRDRLVPIGGLHGLQPVKHGVARITAGTRFVLGVPFHEYR